MIRLTAHGTALRIAHTVIGRVSRTSLPPNTRASAIRVVEGELPREDLSGYAAIITGAQLPDTFEFAAIHGCPTDHLHDRDILSAKPGRAP